MLNCWRAHVPAFPRRSLAADCNSKDMAKTGGHGEGWRELIYAIPPDTTSDLGDRALIAGPAYTLTASARISPTGASQRGLSEEPMPQPNVCRMIDQRAGDLRTTREMAAHGKTLDDERENEKFNSARFGKNKSMGVQWGHWLHRHLLPTGMRKAFAI